MARKRALMAVFTYLDDLLSAIEEMKRAQVKIHTVYAPVPRHEIQEALSLKPSSVRFFTLVGAIVGLVSGLSLAVFTGVQWNLITSGKPVVAWIPFTIVGFEFTILFGIFGNLAGMLVNTRIPRLRLPEHYDPRFSGDRFGILIHCEEGQCETFSGILKGAGAEEVRRFEI